MASDRDSERIPAGDIDGGDVFAEMKAEISKTRSQIAFDMMQQTLQANLVGGGQHGQVSGSSGRRVVNNSSGTERVLPAEVAAGTGLAAAAAATAGAKIVHRGAAFLEEHNLHRV